MGMGRGTGKGRGQARIGCMRSRRLWVCTVFTFVFVVVGLHQSSIDFSSSSSWSTTLGSDRWSFRVWSSSLHTQIRNFLFPNEDEPDVVEAIQATHKSSPSAPSIAQGPRVAICLVGGARSFELTGLSIKKNVLDVYNNSDIFLHVPIDDDARKLTLLQGASKLVMAKIIENGFIPESSEAREVLTGANSPHGIQGLLQYFRLVEGCLDMISAYEYKNNFKYDWIVRTRVDGYWRGPLPPLSTFNPRRYYVPFGSQFGGLNDRLGIGTRNTSWIALSRLSMIPMLFDEGYRSLNSETAFKCQMKSSGTDVEFADFHFCIVTARKYAWPLSRWIVPVASIKSKGALNGAKCKPCHPVATGQTAVKAINELDPSWGWIHPVENLELCDARNDPEPGWESMFDEVSGPEMALFRKKITNRTEEECIQDVHRFKHSWEIWDAPTPETLCRRPTDVPGE